MRQQYRDDYDEAFADEEAVGQLVEHVGPMVVTRGPAALAARQIEAGQAARRVPYFTTAATGLTGVTALGLVEAAAAAGQPALAGTIAVGTWIATGAGLPMLRIRFRDRVGIDGCTVQRIPPAYRRRWWAAGGAAALWIDAMAAGAVDAIGPAGMAAILAGGAWWLSARWMREHDIELPTDPPPPLPPATPPVAIETPPPPVRFPTPPPPDEGDLLAAEWAAEVAAGDNPDAPGSTLGDDREDLPFGYRWVIQLDRRKGVSLTQLRHRVESIALKLGLDKTHIDIDPLPPGQAREDRGLLTIITVDALKGGVDYRGPQYHDGDIPFGMFAAGGGRPKWRARTNTGPLHGMVTGGSGSGKSKLLSLLGMAYKKSREWNIVFTDGDEQGRSAPLLKRIAYDFGKGAAEAMEQLEAMEAWFHAAGHVLGEVTDGPDGLPIPITDPARQYPADKLMPCRRFPGWVWIIDEFHRLVTTLGQAFVKRVERLARIIRKVGGAIIIGTQSAEVGDFGGSDVLRAECRSGNVVLMRTKNANDQYAAGDFGCDPTTLPGGGGYGFTDDPDGVKQQFRAEYAEDMARWVSTLPEYRPEPYQAMVYAAKRPPKGADPVADYHETQQRKAAAKAAIRDGRALPWEDQPEQADAPATPPIAPVGGDGVAAPVPAAPDGPPVWSAGGVGIAAPILGPMFAAPAARPAPPRALTGAEQAVLDRLVDGGGPVKNAVIISSTDLADWAVSRALRELVSVGYAVRHGQGLHEVTAAGRVAAAGCAPASGEHRG